MRVGVFHRIGESNRETFTNSIEQILGFEGLLTFDGVYESVFEHRLALKDKRPVLFISGTQIGRDGFCNKEQLLELEYLGFSLGWHGWTHDRLTNMNELQILSELHKPNWIGWLYAYPHGDFNEQSKSLIKSMGYVNAYSTTQGSDDFYSLRREYI